MCYELVKGKIKRIEAKNDLFCFEPEESENRGFLIKYDIKYGCSYLKNLAGKKVRFRIDYDKLETTGKGNLITSEYYSDGSFNILDVIPEENVMWLYNEVDTIKDLKNKITEAKNNLEEFLNTNPSIDVIRKLDPDFATDNNANYREDINEAYVERIKLDYYLVKYGYAYAYLYYSIYNKLLREYVLEGDSKDINVLSIGAGSRIDLAGLRFAGAMCRHDKINLGNLKYLSLDAADWFGEGATIDSDEGQNVVSYIEEYLDSVDSVDSNVICFPYSMSELDDELNFPDEATRPWNLLCQMLPGKLSSSDVYVVSNLRSATFDVDNNSFDKLKSSMEKCGFNLVKEEIADGRENPMPIYEMDVEEGLSMARKLDYFANIEFMKTKIAQPYDIEACPICNTWILNYRIAHFRKADV